MSDDGGGYNDEVGEGGCVMSDDGKGILYKVGEEGGCVMSDDGVDII